jgi:hypothetical protein
MTFPIIPESCDCTFWNILYTLDEYFYSLPLKQHDRPMRSKDSRFPGFGICDVDI